MTGSCREVRARPRIRTIQGIIPSCESGGTGRRARLRMRFSGFRTTPHQHAAQRKDAVFMRVCCESLFAGPRTTTHGNTKPTDTRTDTNSFRPRSGGASSSILTSLLSAGSLPAWGITPRVPRSATCHRLAVEGGSYPFDMRATLQQSAHSQRALAAAGCCIGQEWARKIAGRRQTVRRLSEVPPL